MDEALPDKETWIGDRAPVQAHLNMLQAIITRMAAASVSCKTWCLALVGAMTSLAGATHQPAVLGYVVIVVTIFLFLDTRYLAQEKAYRRLFGEIVKKIRGDDGGYVMSDAFRLDAPTSRSDHWCALASWSTWPLYTTLSLAYAVAWCMGWTSLLAAGAPR